MYYSLLSLILLNHLHHRKFDYCLISSYFCIYQLFFLSVICWQTAKGLINTLMINPHWFPLIGSGFRKNILWGVYITQIRGLLMLNSKIFTGKHTSFVALTSTFNIMLIHNVSRAKHAAKNLQREITLLPVVQWIFLMWFLFYSGINTGKWSSLKHLKLVCWQISSFMMLCLNRHTKIYEAVKNF